jgi:hypothetical protein
VKTLKQKVKKGIKNSYCKLIKLLCYGTVSFGLSAFSFKPKKVALQNGTPNTG